ncbi:hypothetical protein CQA09_29195 [Klebsiella pneumoniae]|nr:hypothetical protein CQA09_29195 [Klebsiella pneumoniae]
MRRNGITASFGLGGITGTMVDLSTPVTLKRVSRCRPVPAAPRWQ